MKNKQNIIIVFLIIIIAVLGGYIAYRYVVMPASSGQEKPIEEEKKQSSLPEETKEDLKEKESSEEKEEVKEGKKDEKSEEKKEVKEEKKQETPAEKMDKLLKKEGRSGKYWAMIGFEVKEEEDYYEVTGSVYDAAVYAEWVDEVGSLGREEGEAKGNDGLIGETLSFKLPKSLTVEVDKLEGFEIEEKSLAAFFEEGYGTFLFENEGDRIIKFLDWYMNYSG